MAINNPVSLLSSPLISLLIVTGFITTTINASHFKIQEATIKDIHRAFTENKLTSRQLVDFYLHQIQALNPLLRGVLEVNPDAQHQADEADRQRRSNPDCKRLGSLHGIPVLLKDSIATKDKLNTTAGSYSLLGSVVPRDAGVVDRLRTAGAVILGKASLTEWYQFRSFKIPDGWCARNGQALPILSSGSDTINGHDFSIKEASVLDLQLAFSQNKLTSRQLVEFYLAQIRKLNTDLCGVIEMNPDALYQADVADQERKAKGPGSLIGLHGIPILIKDSIATKDKLNTTAGSFALLGSVVPRDAGVVKKLRKAGAIILGKASLNEWSGIRDLNAPNGWSARGGQGQNPYVLSADPCGSSSGSAISVAANMVTVTLGTETDGSIICPASSNSAVGIKPTVGLTSRAGVIPISPRQDTIGPICRTVSDAVYVLDAIVGFDKNDAQATREASKYIPAFGYEQFLKADGLKGKRLGIVRNPFFSSTNDSVLTEAFEHHFNTLRQGGAILVDHLEIANIDVILNFNSSGEAIALMAEFKLSLNAYLKELVVSPVRSLADVIAFNEKFSDLEMNKEFGQDIFLAAEATNGIGDIEKEALLNLATLSRDGFEKVMRENRLDALVTPGSDVSPVLAIGGYPGISVPAGYDSKGVPFGICFGGLKGSDPTLIEIAYGFEQATKVRKPPSFKP